ncbi:Gram-negative bacterial tonB protein (plasmid) [Roseivivax sp. THAF40]|uniref:energy transducer TonB family protein n=1 Tax=unclassified Roseivivax TaxID=2639302 RepID=UPI0012682AE5|nr:MULTISPECIES: energy transducer TonB [unclassified Roseivivax]QFS84873.1 Gram-negative bacterial tonB protein [Roseivivax sp. THAF197b]QFT48775.1 Gram-negative bacterial tonB protein [Roseivivax sp. THAF40]
MMRGAGPAKLAALSVALVVHAALAAALVSVEATEVEGADGGTEVRLGNAFADMAVGTLSSVTAEAPENVAPETPDRLEAERAEPLQPEAATTAPERAPAGTVSPVEAIAVPSETTAERAQAVAISRAKEHPSDVSAVPTASATQVLQSPQVSERVAAEIPESAAVTRSARPKPRSAEFEAEHKPPQMAKAEPQPKTQPDTRAKPAPGNSDRNAQAGEANGQRAAVAMQSGAGGRQKAAGNAAASNYPGLVMGKLSRAGKPRVTARGTAVVAFSIAANGALSSVSLARSSGSAALDQAALRLVRGVGRFPEPPSGARRSFSIQIKGR